MISPGFISDFFGRNSDCLPLVPDEVTEFVKRVIPTKLRTGSKYISKKGRLLISYMELQNIRGLFYKTPLEILEQDPFFAKMRLSVKK